ncbi:MAG: hypothetical protein WCB27_03315 [Thermoguttaceae bacterium]|jgi:hypothetical protein
MSDRRQLRSPPAAVPIFRIVSVVVMLTVIGLTICNLYQRASVDAPRGTEEVVEKTSSVGGTLSRQPSASRSVAAAAKKSRKPAPDEDPEQWKQFRRRSEAILDRSTSIHRTDMPAYRQVMDWVQSQSLANFQARSLPQVPFQDFLQHPDKYRGRPVRVALEIRQVMSFEPENAGKDGMPKRLYELWGVPTELSGWLYVVVTPELPPGFPIGRGLGATTTAYGYFFKVQGYEPFDAKLNARPLLAPMIIGRVAPVSVAGVVAAPWNPLSVILWVVGGLILVAVVGGWGVAVWRRPSSRTAAAFGLPAAMDDNAVDETMDADRAAGVEHE